MSVNKVSVGLVGSGASTTYLLKKMLDNITEEGVVEGLEISIFERSPDLGMGMPYSDRQVASAHVVNILVEETPDLLVSYENWLKSRNDTELKEWGLKKDEICGDLITKRVAMGAFLKCQYDEVVSELKNSGVTVHEHSNTTVVDIIDHSRPNKVSIVTESGDKSTFDKIVISTGHLWPDKDVSERGYFSSPWPIDKLLPKNEEQYNYNVGLLGASLSAYDTTISLAESHGKFIPDEDKSYKYVLNEGAEHFHVTMHTSRGRLPHIRPEFEWPRLEKHRFVSKEKFSEFIDKNDGELHLESFFKKHLKSKLIDSLKKDGLSDVANNMETESAGFSTFIDIMTQRRNYNQPFLDMKNELKEARRSVELEEPIYWKETLDETTYTLNDYTKFMSAEDLLFFQEKLMPFLLNITAFLPHDSTEKLLALEEAGVVSLTRGRVTIPEEQNTDDRTEIIVMDPEKGEQKINYRMFIDSSGQKSITVDQFPFESLVSQGAVSNAMEQFKNQDVAEIFRKRAPHRIVDSGSGNSKLLLGGIEVTPDFNVVGTDGKPNPRIYDIAYPHTKGRNPLNPGLQQCHDVGELLASNILNDLRSKSKTMGQIAMFQNGGRA